MTSARPSHVLPVIKEIEPVLESVLYFVPKFFANSLNEKQEIEKLIVSFQKKVEELSDDAKKKVQDNLNDKMNELQQVQEQMRELDLKGNKGNQLMELEKKSVQISNAVKELRVQTTTQPHKPLIFRGIESIMQSISQSISNISTDRTTLIQIVKEFLTKLNEEYTKKNLKDTKEKSDVENLCKGLENGFVPLVLFLVNEFEVDIEDEEDWQNTNIFQIYTKNNNTSPIGLSKNNSNNSIKTSTTTLPTLSPPSSSSSSSINLALDLNFNKQFTSLQENVNKLQELCSSERTMMERFPQIHQVVTLINSKTSPFFARSQVFKNQILQGISQSQAVLNAAKYEADPNSFQLPPLKTISDATSKVLVLISVLRESLIPCLVATPLVYLTETAFLMGSHADFRKKLRERLDLIENKVKMGLSIDGTGECVVMVGEILMEILGVKIPAMFDVYEDDYVQIKKKNWSDERKIMREELAPLLSKLSRQSCSVENICNAVSGITHILLKYFTYKPLGRPHLYKSDSEWELLNESDLRQNYRINLMQKFILI